MKVFNAKTQELQEVTWSVDANGELICTFEDGHFLKFPAGMSEADLKEALKVHEEHNSGKEVITPEREAEIEAQKAEAEKLIEKLNK